jgi:large subunit ribosomal protein L22
MNKQTATLHYLRMTPRKVRSVANLIKGLPVAEAEAQLLNIRLRAAVPLLKLLRSAVSNLKNNKRMSEEKFFIESLRVDGGPMLKRGLPRARGMMSPIQKKMSHVMLVLAENPNAAPSRFTIVVTKKTKQPPEEEKSIKKDRVVKAEKSEGARAKKSSFFRRMFNRKGFAK